MSVGENTGTFPVIANTGKLGSIQEADTFRFGKNANASLTLNLDRNVVDRSLHLNLLKKMASTARRRKVPTGFSMFFEKNSIKVPVSTVGRNKNVRFGPDGTYRAQPNKFRDAKNRQEAHIGRNRKVARMNIFRKNREIGIKESEVDLASAHTQNMLDPLQALVLLDSEIASSLFYNLFDCLFEKEPDKLIKDELAKAAISILEESVSCDSSVMSSLLLILIKICKTHREIDIKSIERVGIKSLNFSKAILLLEELIIYKGKHIIAEEKKGRNNDSEFDKNKEWISLKRLHEASDSTGSHNLMLDEYLVIEQDPEKGYVCVRETNLGESTDQAEKKQQAKMYLDQLEKSDQFNDLCAELSDEIKHNYYKCKSELLEWESI